MRKDFGHISNYLKKKAGFLNNCDNNDNNSSSCTIFNLFFVLKKFNFYLFIPEIIEVINNH
jgi:hypothetical protein